MIKAIIFDFFGVLERNGVPDRPLLDFIADRLKPKYKIGIISNSSGAGLKKLLGNNVELFDDVVVSEEVQLYKPDPEIYELAAKRLGVSPNQCVYVDNHDYRIEGAEATGMTGIVYKDFVKFEADLSQVLAADSNN